MDWIKKSLKAKFMVLVGSILGALGLLLLVSQGFLSGTIHEYDEMVEGEVGILSNISKMELSFKTQIQEWKNVIIRGSDSGQREKYWGRFKSSEQKVQSYGEKVLGSKATPALKEKVKSFLDSHKELGQKYQAGYSVFLNSNYSTTLADQSVSGIDRQPAKDIAEIHDMADKEFIEVSHALSKSSDTTALIADFVLVAAIFGFFFVTTFVIRKQMLEPMNNLMKKIQDFGDGRPVSFESVREDELGQISNALEKATAVIRQKTEELIANADSAKRLERALDVCQANVMMADNEMNIIYTNQSVSQMLRDAETDLRKDLPNFSSENIIGVNVDTFHKEPSHQRRMISTLKTRYETRIVAGGRTFNLVANPVLDDEGNRLGTVVEWDDLTESLAKQEAEQRVAAENERIKQALDVCQANVMMADENLDIIYTNNSVKEMLSHAETDLRQALPNFRAASVIGTNIDEFHANPSHQRSMLANLKEAYRTTIEISSRTFNLVATPVFDQEKTRIGTVVEWVDRTDALKQEIEDARIAAENARVKVALDNSSTNTMIGDKDNNIVYMNDAINDMMRDAESDLKQALSNFDAANLIGQNMDVFHKNPNHQRSLINNLQSTYKAQIKVAGRTFQLIANPIIDESGERIGTVVEWNDRTQEVSVEEEIDKLIESAGAGDLSARIALDGKDGFFEVLGQGLNKLLGISEGVINDTIRVLDALAHGSLTEYIEADYQGLFNKLKQDANATVNKLTEIITNIRQAANTVSTGANEIAQGNTDLSQRTEEQASSLEETASSMEEMTSAVKQTSDNARHANDLAQSAQSKAVEGGEVVSNAVNAMEEINASSKKIADIIGVIDEIAFQTNLLALNAAVEAARAGEQGRGFAVVAGEVRNLAQRSAGAAKEIKDLIRDSVAKVDNGTELVNASGKTLEEIVQAVGNVNKMISEISEASVEQSSGIEQVNKAVTQMDEMTQQNAALVEEATSAGEAMAEQAQMMMKLMEFFTINQGAAATGTHGSVTPIATATPSQPVKTTFKSESTPSGTPGASSVSSRDDEWDEF